MRTILAIRHAHSTANGTAVPNTMTAKELAFENRRANLDEEGKDQAAALAIELFTRYGIVANRTPVAVSELARAKQTATLLGFRKSLTTVYPVINEVSHGMELGPLRAMLSKNQIPSIALEAAEAVLNQPPAEDLWVTHGLLIAGLCIVLELTDEFDQLIPRCCEVRQLRF